MVTVAGRIIAAKGRADLRTWTTKPLARAETRRRTLARGFPMSEPPHAASRPSCYPSMTNGYEKNAQVPPQLPIGDGLTARSPDR